MKTGLRRGTENNVAPIPEEIHDKIVKSNDFGKVRRSIWRALYDLFSCFPSQDQFTPEDLEEMKHGRASYAKESQRIGNQDKMQIHHLDPKRNYKNQSIANRIANLFIMSPHFHKNGNYISNKDHYGEYHGGEMDKEEEEKERKRRNSIK